MSVVGDYCTATATNAAAADRSLKVLTAAAVIVALCDVPILFPSSEAGTGVLFTGGRLDDCLAPGGAQCG
jgi:hypothetical protein